MLNGLGPALLRGKLPVVLEQQVDDENLDLVGRKEPSGAGMHAVSEPKMLRACRHKLVPMLLASFSTHGVKSESVKLLCIRVHRLVVHHMARHHHTGSFGNNCSVRKGDILRCYPVN